MLKRFSVPALLSLAASTVVAQDADDSVIGMCAGLGTPEACQCAADRLRAEMGAEDYALYQRIGADYLERMAAGEPRGDAWTTAVETAAAGSGSTRTEIMTKTNSIGSAHRAAIKTCSG